MSKNKIRAFEALEEAQKIAFAPFVFQTTVSLRKLGIFNYIFDQRDAGGVTVQEISKSLSLSEYGISVLLEIAETSNIVEKCSENKYSLTKIGYFLTFNTTVNANINFTNNVCYKGLFHLDNAIKTGKPEGLKELGNWRTIYEGLSQLSPETQQSWFDFDHHYSDDIFADSIAKIFTKQPKTIFDIGGNTGKFAIKCCNYNKDVSVKIIDLSGQLEKAMANATASGFKDRVSGYQIDWLSESPHIPNGAEVIWMCQFLDCFSEEEIVKILKTCAKSMSDTTELIIVETFTDRQRFENSRFILEATSLYFAVLANGNSKMYSAEALFKLIDKAGLKIKEDAQMGEYHTMLICEKR